MKLDELAFREGRVAECIVTTYNEDGSPNAAPMGVRKDGAGLNLHVHSGSDTCRNLLDRRACVVNLVFDPLLFLKTALSENPEVEGREVKGAGSVDAPYLTAANAFIEAAAAFLEEETGSDRFGERRVSIFRLEVKAAVILKPSPVAPNRGLSAAIELAIALSRGEEVDIERPLEVMKKTLDRAEYEGVRCFLESWKGSKIK